MERLKLLMEPFYKNMINICLEKSGKAEKTPRMKPMPTPNDLPKAKQPANPSRNVKTRASCEV